MSPQRSAATGKPLKLASGAPMKDCCCDPLPTVDCADCSPPLDFAYDVTLAGFTGTWTIFNGIWTVLWTNDCTWYGEFVVTYPGVDLQVWLVWRNSSPDAWEVTFQVGYWCYRSYRKEASNPCTVRPPGGSYPYFATYGDCDTTRAKDVIISVA
jgi:hypothetical protein